MKRVYFCGAAGCPSVTIHDDGKVEIGEGKNICKLTKEEWNKLVRLIKKEKLAEV